MIPNPGLVWAALFIEVIVTVGVILFHWDSLPDSKLLAIPLIAVPLLIQGAGIYRMTQTYIGISAMSTSGLITAGIETGVYLDRFGNKPADAVNWGVLEPGENATVTVYIRNQGDTPITGATLDTSSWSPAEAPDYMTVTWDFNRLGILYPGRQRSADLTLEVSPQISGIEEFSFDITLTFEG